MKGASFDLILGVLGSVPLPAPESNPRDILETAEIARSGNITTAEAMKISSARTLNAQQLSFTGSGDN